MSGKKLRQRAFAWFMAIAMVLTNITISPLTGLVARAETLTALGFYTNFDGNAGESAGTAIKDITFAPVTDYAPKVTILSKTWYSGEGASKEIISDTSTRIKGKATYTVELLVSRINDNDFGTVNPADVKLWKNAEGNSALNFPVESVSKQITATATNLEAETSNTDVQRTITFVLKTESKPIKAVDVKITGFEKGATPAAVTVAPAENQVGYKVSENGVTWYKGTAADENVVTPSTVFEPNVKYIAKIVLEDIDADGYSFAGTATDDWSKESDPVGTVKTTFGTGTEDKTLTDESLDSGKPTLNVVESKKTLTIYAADTTAKVPFEKADVELKGLENGAKLSDISVTYPTGATAATRGSYTISGVTWYADAENNSLKLNGTTGKVDKNGDLTALAGTDPVFVGGKDYWLTFKIGAGASYEITADTVITLLIDGEAYEGKVYQINTDDQTSHNILFF